MPKTEVIYYQGTDGTTPLLDWMDELPRDAVLKWLARLGRLEQLGHELRRPEADYLEDGIYELRAKHLGVNYRMLYFFHGRTAVVVSHGFSKQQAKVSKRELDLALRRRQAFEAKPSEHTFRPERRDV